MMRAALFPILCLLGCTPSPTEVEVRGTPEHIERMRQKMDSLAADTTRSRPASDVPPYKPSTLILIPSGTTDHPDSSFAGWAGGWPPDDVRVLHGRYWSSAHWTREYIVFLEMEWPKQRTQDFIKDNALREVDRTAVPGLGGPGWFTPPQRMRAWAAEDGSSFTWFFEDPKTRRVFLHEQQL